MKYLVTDGKANVDSKDNIDQTPLYGAIARRDSKYSKFFSFASKPSSQILTEKELTDCLSWAIKKINLHTYHKLELGTYILPSSYVKDLIGFIFRRALA